MSQRLIRIAATALTAAAFLGLAPSAFAALETGDAGDLPSTAQNLGVRPGYADPRELQRAAAMSTCTGCASADGASFSASTVGGTMLDTQLFLFDSQGLGIYSNDDAAFGVRGSRLPAHHRFSPTGPGVYFLAISSFNNDPQSVDGEIFPDMFSRSLYPDVVVDAAGVGGHEPVDRLGRLHARLGGARTASTSRARPAAT